MCPEEDLVTDFPSLKPENNALPKSEVESFLMFIPGPTLIISKTFAQSLGFFF